MNTYTLILIDPHGFQRNVTVKAASMADAKRVARIEPYEYVAQVLEVNT